MATAKVSAIGDAVVVGLGGGGGGVHVLDIPQVLFVVTDACMRKCISDVCACMCVCMYVCSNMYERTSEPASISSHMSCASLQKYVSIFTCKGICCFRRFIV